MYVIHIHIFQFSNNVNDSNAKVENVVNHQQNQTFIRSINCGFKVLFFRLIAIINPMIKLQRILIISVLIGKFHTVSTLINPIKYLRIDQMNHPVQTTNILIMMSFMILNMSSIWIFIIF